MAQVPIYDWLLSDGTPFGCGTRAEFDYWLAEGVNSPDSRLGQIIGYESAAADEKRRQQWAALAKVGA